MGENSYIDKEKAAEQEKKVQAEKKSISKKNSKKPSAFTQILNGDFLTREFVLNNIGFMFFTVMLLLLLISKGYYGKQLFKDVNQTQKELDEMTADYIEAKARMEEETRRYKLVETLGPKGLKETVNPTKVIRIKSTENEQ